MEVLAGGTFVFKVGSAQKSFSLHSKLVTQCSRPLNARILGSIKEAKERSVRLVDVEEETFARFAEYIYGGGYNVPSPAILPDQADSSNESVPEPPAERVTADLEAPTEEPPMHDDLYWGQSHTSKKKTKHRKAPISESLSSFASFALPTLASVPFPQLVAQQVPEDPWSSLDYTEILLCHAQLYVFAKKYDVVGLKDLVLCRMHSVLKVMSSFSQIRKIVPIVEHIYQNIPSMTNSNEPMRDLLTHFVAWKFKTLMGEEGFREYFVKGGDFVIDVCRKVGGRLDT